jgi:hypothetical protein
MPGGNRRLRLAIAGSVATSLAGQAALMVSGPLLARREAPPGRVADGGLRAQRQASGQAEEDDVAATYQG